MEEGDVSEGARSLAVECQRPPGVGLRRGQGRGTQCQGKSRQGNAMSRAWMNRHERPRGVGLALHSRQGLSLDRRQGSKPKAQRQDKAVHIERVRVWSDEQLCAELAATANIGVVLSRAPGQDKVLHAREHSSAVP